jgi:hypothetical protein
MLFAVGGEQPLMVGRKGMQMRGAGAFSAPAWGLLPAFLAMVVTGCTMCPDPHDYSGPVPNGSPPQNDFRARSNGILPIGASPHPWPTIVKTSPGVPRGRTAVGTVAKGEVKQLSAEKPLASDEPSPREEAAEDAVEKPTAAPPVPTRNTVAVIGEVEEAVQEEGQEEELLKEAAEENAPSVPEPEETAADGGKGDLAADETTPAPSPAPVPPLPEEDESLPASEPMAETAPPQSEPAAPAAEEPAAEPAAADGSPASQPRAELRETPGWRPRRSLNPALYGR